MLNVGPISHGFKDSAGFLAEISHPAFFGEKLEGSPRIRSLQTTIPMYQY